MVELADTKVRKAAGAPAAVIDAGVTAVTALTLLALLPLLLRQVASCGGESALEEEHPPDVQLTFR